MSRQFCGGIFFDPKWTIEIGIKYPISLLYYITKKEKYGIEIIKIQYNEKSQLTREVGNIYDISENQNSVKNIINKLKTNYVTPIIMQDVLEDIKYEIKPKS